MKNKLSYLRTKANTPRRQRNEWEPPRKKRLSVFAPKSPMLHASCNNDPSTHRSNVMLLQEEEEKLNPNREVVMDLMRKTFFIRRQSIVKAPASVTKLLKIYPSLRNYDQVSEFVWTIVRAHNMLCMTNHQHFNRWPFHINHGSGVDKGGPDRQVPTHVKYPAFLMFGMPCD